MALKFYSKWTHALRWLLLHKLPTCKQLAPLMSESLERRLTLRERVVLKLHLWICAWCAWYLEQLHMMREALQLRAAQVSEDETHTNIALSPEARERIRRALSQGKQ